ncbi:hypothetical protein [Luteolibacter soli]|uniref:Uncharacterized protein n=1 Tax=Luteolibacter soli TaxID=3135280 RepID=A0ABU9AQ51_9BACT
MKLLPLLALALVTVANARFEETREQCEKRYGKGTPQDKRPSAIQFSKNGISIVAHFGQDGKCDHIEFKSAVGFNSDEVDYLVKVNAWAREPRRNGASPDDGIAQSWMAGKPGEYLAAVTEKWDRVIICNQTGLEWNRKIDGVGATKNPPKAVEGF